MRRPFRVHLTHTPYANRYLLLHLGCLFMRFDSSVSVHCFVRLVMNASFFGASHWIEMSVVRRSRRLVAGGVVDERRSSFVLPPVLRASTTSYSHHDVPSLAVSSPFRSLVVDNSTGNTSCEYPMPTRRRAYFCLRGHFFMHSHWSAFHITR